MDKKHKICLEFTEDAFKRLNEIKDLTETTSNACVIRKALLIYEWFLKQQAENNKIQVVDGNIINEVEFIF